MNDYDVYDEWLWSCLCWMVMKLFMMNGYEVVYDDWLWSGLWWWCYVDAIMIIIMISWWYDAIWFMIWCLCLLIDDMWWCLWLLLMKCEDDIWCYD
jgi:hypothetical protein